MKEFFVNMVMAVITAILGTIAFLLILVITGLAIAIPLVVIANVLKLFGIL